MKAVAIIPRKGGSIHLREVPKPSVGDVEGGRGVEVPADKINPGFVLGNKVVVGTVNANREYFETRVRDMSQAELT
ncbi:MAG: hypothetical protein WBG20_02940 [Candidatus Deferrimicrobiaceae bacterium]